MLRVPRTDTLEVVTDTPRITAAEFLALIHDTIPGSRTLDYTVGPLGWGKARVVLQATEAHGRAGGIISGPTIMALVDTALYVAVLTRLGIEPMAVTTDLNVRFLRPAPIEPLAADATNLRMGRRLAVGDIRVSTVGDARLVAHATGTYALPQG